MTSSRLAAWRRPPARAAGIELSKYTPAVLRRSIAISNFSLWETPEARTSDACPRNSVAAVHDWDHRSRLVKVTKRTEPNDTDTLTETIDLV